MSLLRYLRIRKCENAEKTFVFSIGCELKAFPRKSVWRMLSYISADPRREFKEDPAQRSTLLAVWRRKTVWCKSSSCDPESWIVPDISSNAWTFQEIKVRSMRITIIRYRETLSFRLNLYTEIQRIPLFLIRISY